ncbi:MAG: PQQ-dependent sugar dehydrogenase [Methylococcaceae bacterium]
MNAIKMSLLALLLLNTPISVARLNTPQTVLQQLKLPAGFEISIYAANVANARSLALAEDGTVFVGSGREGKVYALQDKDGDGIAEKRYVIADSLYMPNGVAYKNGALYVAAVNRILRFDNVLEKLGYTQKPVVIYDKFPSDKHHGWKYLRFGSDGKLYTAIGAPCNICESKSDIYTSLVRLNPDGSDLEILASGIRNTVGFDWQPDSNALFFTDNGRDLLGDDMPPDELNYWSQKGEHFGYPYCHGGEIADPELAGNHKCAEFKSPAWQFKAHIAPLGMRFYTGSQFPSDYQKQLFVAQHGSWNRTQPQGYRVVLLKFNGTQVISEQDFISGWLTQNGDILGRPVDILQLQNGSILISDDTLDVIYKVEYKPATH